MNANLLIKMANNDVLKMPCDATVENKEQALAGFATHLTTIPFIITPAGLFWTSHMVNMTVAFDKPSLVAPVEKPNNVYYFKGQLPLNFD